MLRQSENIRFCVLFGLLTLCAACSDPGSEGESDELETVTFNMGWLPQGSTAGVFVAIDRGYYSEVGLNVETARGFGSIRTVNEVDQGLFDFGYADALALVLNRSNGGGARMIGSIYKRWPGGLCFVSERQQIREPADLQGLTIGGGPASPMQVIMPVWLERNGLPRDSVRLMQLDPAIVVNALLEDTIDVSECWLGASVPIFQKRAAEDELTIDWLEYAQFNFGIHGNGLITSDRLIAENPDLVQRFVAATYRGYADMIEHPEEATEILVRSHQVLDPAIILAQIQESIDLIGEPRTLGWLEEEKMAITLETLRSAYEIDSSVTVSDLYTTAFLGRKSGPKPEE
jgi:NitT/TauT family transport system substrate-binding protein